VSAPAAPRPPRERSAPAPPTLTMPLARNLGVMALINILPIAALIWAATTWEGERRKLLPAAYGVVGACLVIAVAAWVALPFGRWLRAWPAWHLRHSRWWPLWLLPAALGLLAWLAIGLCAIASVLSALALVAWSLWRIAPHA
jgi:hypothetical protein